MEGKELILDLKCCDINMFNRADMTRFFKELCDLIDMNREDLHFWDYTGEEDSYLKAESHLKGTSAIQFITTSNVTIHTFDVFRTVCLNIFSCKDFDTLSASNFCASFFKGKITNETVIMRLVK